MYSAHRRPHHTAPRYAPAARTELPASMNTTEHIHRTLFSDYTAPRDGARRMENR
nr:hypothetical protein [Rhodococcus sp. 06-1059B-a]